jgi:single-strand DNA-binding protein
MAQSVNKCILIGHVGKDPTVRETQGGMKIVSFSLATSESWRDRSSGERKEATDWHNVVVFDSRMAEIAERLVKKGSHVYVEGSIKNRKYQDKNTSEDRYITEIVLQAFRGMLTILTPQGRVEEPAEPRQPARTNPRGDPEWEDGDAEIPF